MIGQILDDRYAILRLIGQGGMGAVYEARHVGTNRRVAVKVILSSSMSQSHVARFEREARVVGSVDSQHITTIYDTGRDRQTGSPYIAMELLDGEDADALVERIGALPTDVALRIAYQACVGLGRAHAAGIVHRDVKTANLFLHRREDGERIVKILDFGIAKSADTELGDGSLTREGTMLGSPLYMSPEQAKGAPADARSDVWSMGIVLYELMSARRPNEHIQQLGELIVAICTIPAPWLQDVEPRVPFEVAEIVKRALSIDPAGRYASGAEMAAAIKEFLPNGHAIDESMIRPIEQMDRASIAPRQPGMLTSSGSRSIAATGTHAGVVQPVAPAKGSKAPLLVAAALALALGGVGAALLLRPAADSSGSAASSSSPSSSPPSGSPRSPAGVDSPASTSVTVEPSPSTPTSAPLVAASASAAPPSATSTSTSTAPATAVTKPGAAASARSTAPLTSAKATTKPHAGDAETSRK